MTDLPTYLFAPDRPAWRNPDGPLRWSKTGCELAFGVAEQLRLDHGVIRQNLELIGPLTFGYGTNAETIDEGAARALAEYELGQAIAAAWGYPWFEPLGDKGYWRDLPDHERWYAISPRQAVVVILIWQKALDEFSERNHVFAEFRCDDPERANRRILELKWAKANPDWAAELAKMLRTDEWP